MAARGLPVSDRCPACGSVGLLEGPGAGPHAGSLACGDCGRFVRWTSRHGRATRPLAGLRKNGGEGYGGTLKRAVTLPAGTRLLLFEIADPEPGGPALLLKWVPPGNDA